MHVRRLWIRDKHGTVATMEYEHRSRADGAGSMQVSVNEVVNSPCAPNGHERHGGRPGGCFDKLEIEAAHGAVPVDGLEQDLACAGALHEVYGILQRALSSSLPAPGRHVSCPEHRCPYVYRSHHALAANSVRRRPQDVGILECCGIHDDLLDTTADDGLYGLRRRDTTSVRERHEALAGEFTHQTQIWRTPRSRCIYVEDDDLVHLLLVEDAERVQNVTYVRWTSEPSSFDGASAPRDK